MLLNQNWIEIFHKNIRLSTVTGDSRNALVWRSPDISYQHRNFVINANSKHFRYKHFSTTFRRKYFCPWDVNERIPFFSPLFGEGLVILWFYDSLKWQSFRTSASLTWSIFLSGPSQWSCCVDFLLFYLYLCLLEVSRHSWWGVWGKSVVSESPHQNISCL